MATEQTSLSMETFTWVSTNLESLRATGSTPGRMATLTRDSSKEDSSTARASGRKSPPSRLTKNSRRMAVGESDVTITRETTTSTRKRAGASLNGNVATSIKASI